MNFLNCPEDVCYVNIRCDIGQKAKIVNLVMVETQYANEVDKTSGETMLDSFTLLAVNGKAQLILSINGEKPLPETTELPGRGLSEIKVGPSAHTINFDDYAGVVNVDFYNKIKKTSQNYDFYYITPGIIFDASANEVTLYGNVMIANDLKAFIMTQGRVKWTADDDATPYITSQQLIKEFTQPLVYEFSPSSFEETMTEGATIAGSWIATINKDLPSGSLPEVQYAIEAEDDIDGLGMDFDETKKQYFSKTRKNKIGRMKFLNTQIFQKQKYYRFMEIQKNE
jgi:hypothetical protein